MKRDANEQVLLCGSGDSVCHAQDGREKGETLFRRFLHRGIHAMADTVECGGWKKAQKLRERTQT